MRAMVLESHSPIETTPLKLTDLPTPAPGDNQILVKVCVCGVCHTDLDEVEGRLRPPRFPIVPGHQIVGIRSGASQRGSNVAEAGGHPRRGGPEGVWVRMQACPPTNCS